MIINREELEKFFISYNRTLYKLKLLNIKTKTNNEISHKDLRQAIDIMNKKHPTCRWKCEKNNSKEYYILTEGFYWLVYVYFQREKNIIDADIDFFLMRIKLYENILKVQSKIFWKNDMDINDLEKYFNRATETIRKSIRKMLKYKASYKFFEDGRWKISKEGIEWLCKNCFKHKYLKLLEDYKMDLTEKYVEDGYLYDIF